ncbi:MAG: hypothetical protein M0Z76_08290 [Gammaproteobacteria bacterium]|nr:hypothetical protein [Gammaproteobacteria bacterium]
MKYATIFAPVLALAGAVIGFLLRPADIFGHQLPFSIVMTRGDTLRGLNQLLIPLARQSFNDVLAGALCGLAAGLIVAALSGRR